MKKQTLKLEDALGLKDIHADIKSLFYSKYIESFKIARKFAAKLLQDTLDTSVVKKILTLPATDDLKAVVSEPWETSLLELLIQNSILSIIENNDSNILIGVSGEFRIKKSDLELKGFHTNQMGNIHNELKEVFQVISRETDACILFELYDIQKETILCSYFYRVNSEMSKLK